MKHTPGPWMVGGYPTDVVIGNEMVRIMDFRGFQPWVSYPENKEAADRLEYVRNIETTKANVRLIAAAPELLEAIEMALDEFSQKECNCDGAPDANYSCYFHRIEGAMKRALKKAGAE